MNGLDAPVVGWNGGWGVTALHTNPLSDPGLGLGLSNVGVATLDVEVEVDADSDQGSAKDRGACMAFILRSPSGVARGGMVRVVGAEAR